MPALLSFVIIFDVDGVFFYICNNHLHWVQPQDTRQLFYMASLTLFGSHLFNEDLGFRIFNNYNNKQQLLHYLSNISYNINFNYCTTETTVSQ